MFRYFETRVNPYPEEEPAKPPSSFAAFCWYYTKPVAGWVLAMAVLGALFAIGEVMLFSFLGSIVDWLANADREGFFEREKSRLIFMGLFVLVILPTIGALHSLIIHQTLLGNYPMIARWQMHRYLLKQSMAFFADEFAGRVATKVMQTSLAVRETAMKIADILVYVAVYFISMIVLVSSADWRLGLPLIFWLCGYIAIIIFFVPRLKIVSQRQADARSEMTGRVVDSYTNISTVKLFSHAGREASYAKESMDGFLNTVHSQMRLSTLFHISVNVNNMLVVAAIGALSIWLWYDSLVSVGAIAIAIGLALRLDGMSHWIMWEVSALFENIGVVHDGMEMMRKKRDVVDAENAGALEVSAGAIKFENMSFKYSKEDDVIEKLNLKIAPGEKIGLVGRSGAGKTTLTNVLLRFYDVDDGSVTIDGTNIATVTQESLRAQIGVVTQDTSLLHRSIRENIAYSKPDVSDEVIISAAKRAKAWDFIQGLEDQAGRKGLDAFVGERGVKLSGGQRQRIAIARVFLKDAPILVLDEATSALDSEVEAAIQESLFELMEGKTVIAIAHRLSTIASLDRLIVMDEGKIVESGSHEELVNAGNIYSDLWSRQSGGFLGIENVAEMKDQP